MNEVTPPKEHNPGVRTTNTQQPLIHWYMVVKLCNAIKLNYSLFFSQSPQKMIKPILKVHKFVVSIAEMCALRLFSLFIFFQ